MVRRDTVAAVERDAALTERAIAELALRALRVTLLVTAAAAVAGLVGAAVDGGSAPWRVPEGLAIAALALVAATHAERSAVLLRTRGGLIAYVAVLAALLALDGHGESPFVSVGYVAVAVAVVVASPLRVAMCAVLLVFGWSAGELVDGHGLGFLFGDGFGRLLNEIVDVTVPAALLLCTLEAGRRTLREAPVTLTAARYGGGGAPPALLAAVRSTPAALPRANAASIVGRLSPAEARVVELVAEGLAPKQVALALGIGLPTVRSHLAAAKRKTDAATIPQLAGLWAEAHADV
jgi:DNA-binding CsgD family transcriptional regulator